MRGTRTLDCAALKASPAAAMQIGELDWVEHPSLGLAPLLLPLPRMERDFMREMVLLLCGSILL